MIPSIKKRLLVLITFPTLALWLIATGGVVWVIEHELSEIFDSSLQETAQRILPLSIKEIENYKTSQSIILIEDISDHKEYLTYQITNNKGDILLKSHGAPDTVITPVIKTGFHITPNSRVYTESTADEKYFIHIAEPGTHRFSTLWGIIKFLLIPLLAAIPIIVASIYWGVHSSQKIIKKFSNEIENISGSNLHPINIASLPREFIYIGESINALIYRLNSAIKAERFFSENTAHELRTPIANSLSQIELLISKTNEIDYTNRLNKAHHSLVTMEKLVTKLLQLAKSESGTALNFKKVSLNFLLQIIVDEQKKQFSGRTYSLKTPSEEILIDADIDALGIAIVNLLENANQYAPPNTTIEIELDLNKSIHIKNECELIPKEDLKLLTNRYHRIKNNGSGLGIGLSIVKSIVEQTNGEMEIQSPISGRPSGIEIILKF